MGARVNKQRQPGLEWLGKLWYLLALSLLFLSATARSEIWAFVDDRGVTRFAAEQIDPRYALFFLGAEAPSVLAPYPGATTSGLRDPAGLSRPTASRAWLLGFLDRSPLYRSVRQPIAQAATSHGLELELLQALIAAESGFDALAVSPKGAIGLMQVMPATAARFGLPNDGRTPVQKKLADPALNLSTGSRYLRHLMGLFPGQLELVLAAYNAGEGAVQRAGNAVPNYPETQNYVKTVLQLYWLLKSAEPLQVAQSGAAAAGEPPSRVLPILSEVRGGAFGRANMIAPFETRLPARPTKIPTEP